MKDIVATCGTGIYTHLNCPKGVMCKAAGIEYTERKRASEVSIDKGQTAYTQ